MVDPCIECKITPDYDDFGIDTPVALPKGICLECCVIYLTLEVKVW